MVKSESLVIAEERKAQINKRIAEATLADRGHTKALSN
jgi:hypothetical protein